MERRLRGEEIKRKPGHGLTWPGKDRVANEPNLEPLVIRKQGKRRFSVHTVLHFRQLKKRIVANLVIGVCFVERWD